MSTIPVGSVPPTLENLIASPTLSPWPVTLITVVVDTVIVHCIGPPVNTPVIVPDALVTARLELPNAVLMAICGAGVAVPVATTLC